MLEALAEARERLPYKCTSGLVGHTVAEVECELLIQTLGHHKGCRTHAAKTLGISIRTLRNKIREYEAAGMVVPRPLAEATVFF